jgi:putative Mn2+ efflux pump MntP
MSLQALILVAIGLSMDAFGASISRGAAFGRLPLGRSAAIAGLFGLFAVIAPVIGWAVGAAFYDLIEALDHWIAFCLLSAIGIKMIVDARGGTTDSAVGGAPIRILIVLVSAIATNIGATVVGIALPGLRVDIWSAAAIIGCATLLTSFVGLQIGRITGAAFGHRAEIAGGLILIAIGTKILLEHTILAKSVAATHFGVSFQNLVFG